MSNNDDRWTVLLLVAKKRTCRRSFTRPSSEHVPAHSLPRGGSYLSPTCVFARESCARGKLRCNGVCKLFLLW